ncbi:MAG: hypothetical protein WCO18_01210 [bacterium]
MDIDNNKIIFRIGAFVVGIISAIFFPWYISALLLFVSILTISGTEAIFVSIILDIMYGQGGFKGHLFLISSFLLLLIIFEIKKNLRFSK